MDKPVAGLALEVTLPFLKMHGAGNDFMVLDLRQNGDPSVVNANAVTHWADRRTGVGFDQLLVLTPGDRETSSARITIWNADGSSAEQCGNGMRCIGLYLAEHDGLGTDPISIDSAAGPLELRHRGGDQVSVRMGRPRFDPGEIPLNLTPETTGEYRLDINGTSLRFGALSMGNPHAVIEVERVRHAPLETLGMALQSHAAFPQGCNVGFVERVSREEVKLRVLERGAGETRACGSGACAAAAWLHKIGHTSDKVRVVQSGGSLVISFDRDDGSLTLTGPAKKVFEGLLE